MKIGILTFHEADSYGAVLQAYALQQTLLKLGADSEFVQIQMPQSSGQTQNATGAAAIFARKMQAEGEKRAALFADFRRNHMKISRPYQPGENIDGDYDAFVAGSDQIWNFRIPGADARYFLPFASPEKRFSYAASFGADALPEKASAWAAVQLSRFREISVREESGCRIVADLTGREARVCLDPTLLPSREDWLALTREETAQPYVLAFLLKYDETLVAKAREEAEKRGVQLRVITAAFMPKLGIGAWNTTGVTDWLNAIRNAQCVFTNSFHGMVFSLIFARAFHVQRLTGELSSRNGRLEELLSFLELSAAMDDVVQPGDGVWQLLESRKAASLDYLRRITKYDTAV